MQMRRSRNVIFNERGAFNRRKRRLIFACLRFTKPDSTPRCSRRRISTWPYNFVSSRSFALCGASRICPFALKILAVQAKNCRPRGEMLAPWKRGCSNPASNRRQPNHLSNVKRPGIVSLAFHRVSSRNSTLTLRRSKNYRRGEIQQKYRLLETKLVNF